MIHHWLMLSSDKDSWDSGDKAKLFSFLAQLNDKNVQVFARKKGEEVDYGNAWAAINLSVINLATLDPDISSKHINACRHCFTKYMFHAQILDPLSSFVPTDLLFKERLDLEKAPYSNLPFLQQLMNFLFLEGPQAILSCEGTYSSSTKNILVQISHQGIVSTEEDGFDIQTFVYDHPHWFTPQK
ncbi:hypothetical protein ACFYKX_10065 [Cytobacillus sp. FJAT-54145]|uniref:Uncharacterized protein n=1 Tax=Cytobacillus spartinae TaxID=3299023 RepID=A0ABW6K9X2_9BACI